MAKEPEHTKSKEQQQENFHSGLRSPSAVASQNALRQLELLDLDSFGCVPYTLSEHRNPRAA
jgi:hypothetical protein